MEIPFPTPTQSDFDKAAARFVEPMVVNASAVVYLDTRLLPKAAGCADEAECYQEVVLGRQ